MQTISAKSLRALLLLVMVALVGSGVGAFSQGTSGSLTGQVTDPTGAAIVGATVTLTNVGTDLVQTGTSDSTGSYLLKPVMPGNYSLTIAAKGFAEYVQHGIVITANQYATQDVSLRIASASNEVVTVTANAELINTTSAELGSTVNEAAISQLPLNGRDPSSLVLLAPGTVNVLNHGGEGIQTGFSFPTETGASAAGGRQGSTFYMLDGVTNMDNYNLLTAPFPNADATQEFKVITSNYGAQYGFAPGAVVSIATKSGTNTFHGGAFWYVRNNAMNATNWFSGQTDTLRRNQFGAYAGGPIKKDKLFVFGNYQGTKIIWNSTDTLTSTPTAAMLTGDFSGLASAADLASGTTDINGPFKTIGGKPNQLDTSIASLSPAALYFAKYGMIRAATTVSNNATLTPGVQAADGDMMYTYPTVHNSYDEGTLKLDYNISPSQILTLRSYTNIYNQPSSDVPGNMESAYNHSSWTATFWNQQDYFNNLLQHTWTINPKTVNSISVFMTQMSAHSAAQELDSTGKAMCFSNVSIGVNEIPGSCYMGALRINSNYGFESGWDEPSVEVRTTLGLTDTLNKTLGKHSITTGVDLMHQHAVENTQYPTQPLIGFGRNGTGAGKSPLLLTSTSVQNDDVALADFMMGLAQGYMQGAGEISDVAGWQVGPFIQDDWKILPNLTINLGLRWDPNTPPVSQGDRGAAWIPGVNTSSVNMGFVNNTPGQQSTVFTNAPAGLDFPGDPGVPDTLMNSDYGYWEPRIGLAYQPKFLPKTVIHAGFGMFTGPLQYSEYNHAADVAPFSPTFNFSGWCWPCSADTAIPQTEGVIPFDNPWSASTAGSPYATSPFPGTFPWASVSYKPAKTVAIPKGQQISQVFARNFKLPTVYAWNVSVEHQLTSTTALRLAYVGNETDHLSALIDMNPPYASAWTPNANFGDIYDDQSWATASYNSLQFSLDQHVWHGLQVQSSFTWAHSIDIASSSNVSFGNPALGNPISAAWNRGNSYQDMPWNWISNFIYLAPSFKEKGKLMEETVGGWQLSGIITWQAGNPFSIGQWDTDPGVGMWANRADFVPGVAANMGKGSHWDWVNPAKGYFNEAAFTLPVSCADKTPGWCGFGDTSRDAYWGPGVFGIDASIMKNWVLMEGKTFQFRWDAFNATNHPSFANPASTINQGAGTFGIITGTNSQPRIFQGALRLTF